MSASELVILCNEAAARKSAAGENAVKLRTSGSHRNVRLELDQVGSQLNAQAPPRIVDLVEIATLVYVADQIQRRGADDVESMGAHWRRRLRFEISVRDLAFWKSGPVTEALVELLSFLSEDEYEFTFSQYQHPPTLDSYLTFGNGTGNSPESVILFSGGLDSLGGVVERVVTGGENALLVTHESTTKLRTRHQTLRSMIDGAVKGTPPQHITVRINKKDQQEKEYTQRARSFLYAALATAIARLAGLEGIKFFENGVVSLNLPLSPQVVGARATRTTHPLVLTRMRRLFSLVAGVNFNVENGFLWKTKADVVRGLVDAGFGSMLSWSTSCTHTWTFSNAKPHCGECSQCIDRRFAVLAGGAAAFEKAGTYAKDLLLDDRSVGESRIMLASYVELAQQVATMSEAEFFGRFGEAARMLRHVGMPDDEAARAIFRLYQRHSAQVVSVVDAALAENSVRIRQRNLPDSCLLRLVHDPSVPESGSIPATPAPTPAASKPDYQLERRGKGWLLRFAGEEAYLERSIGIIYLRELVGFPGKAFTDAQLLVAARPQAKGLPTARGEASFDAIAGKAYHARLTELNGAIAEAERDNDFTLKAAYEAEKDQLLKELKAAKFAGRTKLESRDHKRIRDRVRNAIERCFDELDKYHKPAAAHFRASTTRGGAMSYAPTDLPGWVL